MSSLFRAYPEIYYNIPKANRSSITNIRGDPSNTYRFIKASAVGGANCSGTERIQRQIVPILGETGADFATGQWVGEILRQTRTVDPPRISSIPFRCAVEIEFTFHTAALKLK